MPYSSKGWLPSNDGKSMRPDGHTLEAENEQEVEPSSQLHRKKRLESKRMTCWKREGFHQDREGVGNENTVIHYIHTKLLKKFLRAYPSDPLPPVKLYPWEVPQPSQMVSPAGDQAFKQMSLWETFHIEMIAVPKVWDVGNMNSF